MTPEEKKAEEAKLKAQAEETAKLEAKAKEDEKKVEAKAPEGEKKVEAKTAPKTGEHLLAAEKQRIAKIEAICCKPEYASSVGLDKIQAKAINEGWDVYQAEVACLRASRPVIGPAAHPIAANTTSKVLEAAAMMALNRDDATLNASYNEPTLEAASKLRGIGLRGICELAASGVGVQMPSFSTNREDWLRAAFSTASVSGLLSNIAQKTLLDGFNYSDQTWREICRIASVNDFKEHTRYRLNSDFKFDEIGADGEFKHGQIGEESYGNKVATHGKMFSLTRQMIINDDLGAFTELPWQIGVGANDAINDMVWPLLLSLVSSGFFASGNSNYAAGAGTAFGVGGLTQAIKLMRKMPAKGKKTKRPSGVKPSVLLVPPNLEFEALRLMNAVDFNETTTADSPKANFNPYKGRFKVACTEYIGGEYLANGSDLAWYLFADPKIKAAIEIAFLGGKDTPTVERADTAFNTLGIQFRAYLDAGVRQQDHQGVVKLKGEV